MKTIELRDCFGITNLQVTEQPKPSPAQGEVLVRMEAASLNYVDLLVIKGLLNSNIPLPYIPVCDGAGIVESVGEEVTEFKPGDKVATTFISNWVSGKPTPQTVDFATRPGLGTVPGQLSEYKIFRGNQLIKSPENLSSIEASTLPIAGLTAWNALRYGNLQAGDTRLNGLSLLVKQATIKGMEVGSTRDFEAMNRAIAANDIHPVIDGNFLIKQAQAAFEYLERGSYFGKVVITF